MGIASKERPGRLEEMIQALRVLWSDEHASFHGKYYSFEDVDLAAQTRFNSRAPSTSRVPRGQLASVSVELSARYGASPVTRTAG